MNPFPPIFSLAADHSAAFSATDAPIPIPIPIPIYTGWVGGFLLMILWLFIAAIVLGPIVNHFKLEPRSAQKFSDDPHTPSH
jgi:hypothetical protein